MSTQPQETIETAVTRLRWIQDAGKEIFFLDFKHATVAESLEMLDALKQNLQGRPAQSVLVLADVTGASYNPSVSTRWKGTRMAFAPIVRATAVYGMSGMVALSLRGAAEVQRLMGLARAGDEQKYFKTRAEALAWLHKL
jgi:hypothetical protein